MTMDTLSETVEAVEHRIRALTMTLGAQTVRPASIASSRPFMSYCPPVAHRNAFIWLLSFDFVPCSRVPVWLEEVSLPSCDLKT